MNLYKFYYIKDPNAISNMERITDVKKYIEFTESVPLIGYTTDKETRDRFVDSRNMEVIREIKSKDIEEEEYQEFNSQHKEEFLDLYTITGYEVNDDELEEYSYLLPASFSEMEMLQMLVDGMYEDDLVVYIASSPIILNEKYFNLLWKLRYVPLYYTVSRTDFDQERFEELKEVEETQKYYEPTRKMVENLTPLLYFDEVNLFIKAMSYLF